jgi:hypothetical protein
LTTYEEVAPLALLIEQQVATREMPPWRAAQGCREYHHDESLDEAHIATIAQWAAAGAPAGDPDGPADPAPQMSFSTLSRVDLKLTMTQPYLPEIYPDDYRCFVLDWPLDKPAYVTGFGVQPGNNAIVHHIIAYRVDAAQASTFAALDAQDPGPGYTCFGSPGGGSGFGVLNGVSWLGGWAPGTVGSDFSPGTGIRMNPGAKVVVQVHYNLLASNDEPDQTSVLLKVDEKVGTEAFILPWTNPMWVASGSMHIPAGNPDAVHSFAADPTYLSFYSETYTLHSASVHMHQLASAGRVTVERANGTSECLVNIPNYDFEWQRSYGFKQPVVIHPGDQLRLECHWDNSPNNQIVVDGQKLPTKDVYWGEGTTDEMCLGIFYVTTQPI